MSSLSFWEVQNTGWSGGTSWFTCGQRDPLRFKNMEDATDYIARNRDLYNTQWRIVEVTIERHGDDNLGGENIYRNWAIVL